MSVKLSRIPLVAAAGGVVGQIAMVVDDLREAMATWGTGHAPSWRVWKYGPDMIQVQTYLGAPSNYSMYLAMLGSSPQVELIEPLDGPSIYHTWREQGGVGIHHLGFYVGDLEPVTTEMEAAGYPCVMTGQNYGADGTGQFAYYDTRPTLGFYVEGIQVPTVRREPLYVWPDSEGGSIGRS